MIEAWCATSNPHKVEELRALIGHRFILQPRPMECADPVEDGMTFAENALIKARAVAATGRFAIADDSGLMVDALSGAPGVYSARYAGEGASDADNVAKLLQELSSMPDETVRTARFVCVLAAVWPEGAAITVQGTVEGVIARAPRGADGFGYDPVFEPVEAQGMTFAELSQAEKNAMSHRARAAEALLDMVGAIDGR